MLYDQAQLLTSALEFSLLIPSSDPSHPILQDMAKDIIRYVSLYLKSPEGGFYSSEDADSVPAFEGGPGKLTEVEDSHGKIEKVEPKPKEGAFYVWTEEELDNLLGGDSEVFKYLFGVEKGGNCDPRHDIQGELKGKVSMCKHYDPDLWVCCRYCYLYTLPFFSLRMFYTPLIRLKKQRRSSASLRRK